MRLLRLKEVSSILAIKKATIYKKICQGVFPKPSKVGKMSVWNEEEVFALVRAYSAGLDENNIKEVVKNIEEDRKNLMVAYVV